MSSAETRLNIATTPLRRGPWTETNAGALAFENREKETQVSVPLGASQAEINHAAYPKYREALEREHAGRVVLMRDGEVVRIFNDKGDAYEYGHETFGFGNFSMKRIGERPAQLGIMAQVMSRP